MSRLLQPFIVSKIRLGSYYMQQSGAKRWYFDGNTVQLVQITVVYENITPFSRGGDEENGRKYVLAEATDGQVTIPCILLGEAYEQYDRTEHIKFASTVLNSLVQVHLRELVYLKEPAIDRIKHTRETWSTVEEKFGLPGPDILPLFIVDRFEVVSRLKGSTRDLNANGNTNSLNGVVTVRQQFTNMISQPLDSSRRLSNLDSLAGLALSSQYHIPLSPLDEFFDQDVDKTAHSVESSQNQWWKTDPEDLHFGEDSEVTCKRSKRERRRKTDSQSTASASLGPRRKPSAVVLPIYPSIDENDSGNVNSFGILLEAAAQESDENVQQNHEEPPQIAAVEVPVAIPKPARRGRRKASGLSKTAKSQPSSNAVQSVPQVTPPPECSDIIEVSYKPKHLQHRPKPLHFATRPYTLSKATYGMHKNHIIAYLHHRANEL